MTAIIPFFRRPNQVSVGDNGMVHFHVALTALTDSLRADELAALPLPLCKCQITRDFAPEWGSAAIVGAFPFDALPSRATRRLSSRTRWKPKASTDFTGPADDDYALYRGALRPDLVLGGKS